MTGVELHRKFAKGGYLSLESSRTVALNTERPPGGLTAAMLRRERETQDWPRAARFVNGRMDELGMTQMDLVRRSGVSDATVRKVMRGTKMAYRQSSLAEISKALGWPPNTLERLSQGEEPPKMVDYLDRQQLLRRVREMRRLVDALEDDLRRSGSM